MKSRRWWIRFSVAVLGLLTACFYSKPLQAQLTGGMLNPSIDVPGEPFSYFLHPTDVVGALYDPVASEVTPEGYVYTGSGELMFYIGNPLEAVNQRIKTLDQGYLPVVQYKIRRDGIEYAFKIWADDLGGGLKGLPVNFVQVELSNSTHEQHTGFLSSAYRFSSPDMTLHGGPGDYRFGQRFELMPKQYIEGQTKFNPDWKYAWGTDSLVRDQRLLYLFPATPKYDQRSLSLGDTGLRMVKYFTGEIEGNPDPKYTLRPLTPMGVVMYRVSLKPGEKQSLVFKMPIIPIPDGSPEVQQIRAADPGASLQHLDSLWTKLINQNPPLRFPEEKVQQYLLANTVLDLLAIDKVSGDLIQNINKFQYHDPYGGATSVNMLIASLYTGLNEIARDGLLYFYKVQQPDGKFIMDNHPKSLYWELFGYTLWGWGRYYQLTHDDDFLRQIYPGVVRAMEWQKKISGADPLGLMPVSTISDDAYLKDTYQTGMNMWVLVGLKNAIALSEGMGKKDDTAKFKAQYQTFWTAFERQLNTQTAKTGGYIPPGLNRTLLGNNWDNLLTLYPEPLFKPFDPRVTATIHESRATYVEGILGYVYPGAIAHDGNDYIFDTASRLHYWQDPDNAENELVRGDPKDQELAVKDLYALLLHTTSTHAPQEYGTYPWSDRDYHSGDILPDGSSSGKTIELLRNMLVREYGDELYFFSAVSPAWVQPGMEIDIRGEQTVFGPVTAVLKATATGLQIQFANRFRQAPEHVIIPIPWFYQVDAAEADGDSVKITAGKLILPASTQTVNLRGRIKPGTTPISFDHAVTDYQQEYKTKYQQFLKTGTISLKKPRN
jgi:hypothetical protein